MPPNGPDEWRARIGHWENRKLRWYQAHCRSRPRFPLHPRLVISEAPRLVVLLLLSLTGNVTTGVCEAGNGILSSLGKLVAQAQCHASDRRVKVWVTPLFSLFLALSLLLLVAGDVETNPGPINDELLAQVDESNLTEEDTHDVYREVVSLAGSWSSMCLALRLLPSDQSAIAAAHPGNPHKCLEAVIVKWLQKGYNYQKHGPPTWRMLVEAVGDPAGGNNCALAETIANKHPVKASTKPPPDPREYHHLCREFATTFTELTTILNTSVHISELKEFLESYSHPLYPEQHYVDQEIYRDASTTKEVLKSLFPRYINYMHYYLLEDIVVKFGCDRAKEVLRQYTDQKYSRKRKLNSLPGPITDGEIEQFHSTKTLKIQVEGDTSDATVETIVEIQKALEKSSGIKRAVITYAFHDPGSIFLTFLVPECLLHIFQELSNEDLAVLADSGVTKLEIDALVIEDIQQYSPVQNNVAEFEVAAENGALTKPKGLWDYLKKRAAEMAPEKCLRLLKMLGTADPQMLNDVCSEEFLQWFAKDLHDWKKLAHYFSIHEQTIEDLVHKYPDVINQKYQALLCWKKAERSTATHYNLLEYLILHGNIGEVEALLERLGEGPVVLHASSWLKQQYMAYDSWQQWREVPNLLQFNQRLGELTAKASKQVEQLRNMDYSNCYFDVQDEFPSCVTPVSVKSLVNACESYDHSWSSECILIKGAPGQGKSFLLSKICKYWALGYGMRRITLLFMVNCHQFQNRRMTLFQLLSQLLTVEIQNIYKWIMNRQGKNVIFILDGYDHQEKGDVFWNLSSRKLLPKSVVVIASTCTPSKVSVKELELLALTENQIHKQISKVLEFSPSKLEDFYLYLTNNSDMKLLVSNPVHLYSLLFVCNKLIGNPSSKLPVTWTELYTSMTLLLLRSTFSKLQEVKIPHDSSDCPPNTVASFLHEVSTVAFENLANKSFTLALPAARSYSHVSGFPLVHICSNVLYHNEKQCFQFSSLLLQQFLAALHIHGLPVTMQTELMVQKSEHTFLWQFYAGLLISESYDKFEILKKVYQKEGIKTLADCAYEADWACDIPSVFKGNILTAVNMHHIVGFKFLPNLRFNRCFLGRVAVLQLARQVHTFAQCGNQSFKVTFDDCIFSSEGLRSVATAPFQKLRLDGLSTKDLCSFAMGLKKCQWAKGVKCLEYLVSQNSLAWCRISSKAASAIAKALQTNRSLLTLNLAKCRISTERLILVAAALKTNCTLQTLKLEGNAIKDAGANALANSLKVNHGLITLSIHSNFLTSAGAMALAKALEQNKTLQTLNLDWDKYKWTDIGDEGTTALADVLRLPSKSFKRLHLRGNGLSSTGAIALARALQHNKSLEKLDLELNEIGNSGATALADALRVNQSLKSLNLEWTGIGDKGAAALGDALKVNLSLVTLNLGVLCDISVSTKQLLRGTERISVSFM